MTQPTTTIEPVSAHAEMATELESKLLATLAVKNTQSTNSTILLSTKDSAGQLVGGVYGSTSYGWFLIKLLWVSKETRNCGVGRQLMHDAEKQARIANCHSAWLDTSHDEARQFYLRLGYTVFGVLDNVPDNEPIEHKRWFMKKSLLVQ